MGRGGGMSRGSDAALKIKGVCRWPDFAATPPPLNSGGEACSGPLKIGFSAGLCMGRTYV